MCRELRGEVRNWLLLLAFSEAPATIGYLLSRDFDNCSFLASATVFSGASRSLEGERGGEESKFDGNNWIVHLNYCTAKPPSLIALRHRRL